MHDRTEARDPATAEIGKFAWEIIGRTPPGHSAGGWPPQDWRDQLAARLGYRPRRIGILAELALYGALACLAKANEEELPGDVLVRVSSLRGPVSAIANVLEQIGEDLPMPFSFLQSQTSQILPALTGALNWQGDASVITARNPVDSALLACRQAGRSGMLLGWVEEGEPCESHWVRLAPCTVSPRGFVAAASFDEICSTSARYWRLGKAGIEIAPLP